MNHLKRSLLTATVAALALTACGSSTTHSTQSPSTSNPSPSPSSTFLSGSDLYNGLNVNLAQVKEVLAVIPVAKKAPLAGFKESLFPTGDIASHYQDWPLQGTQYEKCMTSSDAVLVRDGAPGVHVGSCKVRAGAWIDPYTGEHLSRAKVVSSFPVTPQEAWFAGANKWTATQRAIFSNSSLSLVAAGQDVVSKKGNRDEVSWQPEGAEPRCAYATRVTMIYDNYGLTFYSQAQKKVLTEMLRDCG